MPAEGMIRKVPIKERLFQLPGDGQQGHLIASRCRACGEHFHPPRAVCLNCYGKDLEEVALSQRGTIRTYTVARTGYPHSPVKAPFVTAQVQLPEGVTVLSLITGVDPERVKIGTEVELYFWKTGEDEKGNEVMAYAFRPAGSGEREER